MTTDYVSGIPRARTQPHQVTIAGTSLVTSRLGLGTHSLHRLLSRSARQNLLALAHESGARYFDTAPSYGAGIAERELGLFGRGRRSEWVLTTKFGIPPGRLAATVPGWVYMAMAMRALAKVASGRRSSGRGPRRDYTAASAQASVERSLRALKTDHLDILYLHEPTLGLLGDTAALARTLDTMKACGKIGFVGLSGGHSNCLEIAKAHPSLAEVLQIELPRDSEGLPAVGLPEANHAVGFWEFAGPGDQQPDRLARIARRLRANASNGVVMVSTNNAAELRAIVTILQQEP